MDVVKVPRRRFYLPFIHTGNYMKERILRMVSVNLRDTEA